MIDIQQKKSQMKLVPARQAKTLRSAKVHGLEITEIHPVSRLCLAWVEAPWLANNLLIGMALICTFLIGLDYIFMGSLYGRFAPFGLSVGLYGLIGMVAVCGSVLASWGLGPILHRHNDYYGEEITPQNDREPEG